METKDFVTSFRKEFGEDSIFLLGEDERLADIKVRSSGSLLLDLAMGGGFAQGRLTLLRGAEKSGKTTIACLAIAEAQKNEPEKNNAIIDLENSFNPDWAATLGVDTDRLMILQPDTHAEKVYDMLEYMLKKGNFSFIVLDSLDGLIPKEELEETDWDKESRVGGTAKLNSKAMRKIVNSGLLRESGASLIFIQQLRDKIGGFSLYGTQVIAK
jgi:recombination protein RecA